MTKLGFLEMLLIWQTSLFWMVLLAWRNADAAYKVVCYFEQHESWKRLGIRALLAFGRPCWSFCALAEKLSDFEHIELVNKPYDEAGSKGFRKSFPEERRMSIIRLGNLGFSVECYWKLELRLNTYFSCPLLPSITFTEVIKPRFFIVWIASSTFFSARFFWRATK